MKPKKKRRWIWVAAVIVFLSIMSVVYEPETDNTLSENPDTSAVELSTELSDAEWEQIQTIFTKYVGKDIEYKPVYCGEWREGRQYKTETYAYGQYLIDMDEDGQVHLIVWVQDKKGSEGRTVVYNRLDQK